MQSKRILIFFVCSFFITGNLAGQIRLLRHFKLDMPSSTSSQPPSNSVSQINVLGSTLWIGTSKGLASSANAARSWVTYRENTAFANDGIFAVATRPNLVWSATGFDKDIGDGNSVQTGSGYAYSTDDGFTWMHVNQ